MGTFCTSSNTSATVSINGSEVLTETDLPITITIEKLPDTTTYETRDDTDYLVDIYYHYRENWMPAGGGWDEMVTRQFRGSFGGLSIDPHNIIKMSYVVGGVTTTINAVSAVGYVYFSSPSASNIRVLATNTIISPTTIPGKWRLNISNSLGANIFSSQYDTEPEYTVDCSNCPPGTLSCEDCCLPCDEIYNQISGIRALIARIK